MGSNMLDHSGKPTGSHMGVPPVRAPQDRKIRGQAAAAASGGTTKRTPRMPRSAAGRPTTLQPQAPTAPNVYPTQPGAGAHAVYQAGAYSQWIQPSNMPGAQQPSMMPAYQNNPQMKQAHAMQNVRPTGIPNRPGVAYANQPIQQPPSVQAPMSVNYMPDQSSIMMPSSGVPSAQANRPGVPPIGKRKLNEANMYGNDQPQYTTPAKMPLQSAGKIDHRVRSPRKLVAPSVGAMPQYQPNQVMMQQNNYMQQAQQPQQQQQQPPPQQQQQAVHAQMYGQGQMPSAPYMTNQMLGNSAR